MSDADADIVSRNAHISSEEVRQDILDTEREIADLEREETGLRMIGDKMSMFRVDARRHGINERRLFIAKLNKLLIARDARLTERAQE